MISDFLRRFMLLIILVSIPVALYAQLQDGPVLWYSFDEMQFNPKQHLRTIENKSGNGSDTISGTYVALKNGVSGKSLLVDGYSSFLSSRDVPDIKGNFTLEGWTALGAYPTNYAPIAEQSSGANTGCSLGFNAYGFPECRIATVSGREDLIYKEVIPLFKWTHIAATYDGKIFRLYVNGKCKASKELTSAFVPSKNGTFYCGVSSDRTQPIGTIREGSTGYVEHFIDGLMDEVKAWNKVADVAYFERIKQLAAAQKAPDLDKRHLPDLPSTGHFGAVYANLKFYESWDKIWRVFGDPDVVVNFDQFDGHFVFWRGASYIPHWVTENGIWYDNEFCETWDKRGCHEPMSDKRCEFSQVKIVESTPARCVIQWRYALIDNWRNIAHIDSITGWGDWVDEFYTIYPNGVAVRSQNLHGSHIAGYDEGISHEWHESILVMGQGQSPESVLYPEAITMANMKGEEHSYSWIKNPPKERKENITYIIEKDNGWASDWLDEIEGINIQLVNTRSKNKPFVIIDPEDKPKWDVYSGEIRRDISIFPWWNHWPTSVKPSDGRYALFSDRASHSSLTHVFKWKPYKVGVESQTRLMLNGLTQQKASDLVTVTEYWCNPPQLEVTGSQIESSGFDKEQMAYILTCKGNENINTKLRVEGRANSPIVNPAFVFTNWNSENTAIKLNGKKIKDSKTVKCGFVQTAEGINMIVWINSTFKEPLELAVEK